MPLKISKRHRSVLVHLITLVCLHVLDGNCEVLAQKPVLQFTVSMANPEKQYFHVELTCKGWNTDTVTFKMPVWMPGYYQVMNYSGMLENFTVDNDILSKGPVKTPGWLSILKGKYCVSNMM